MNKPSGNLSVVSPAEYKISVAGFLEESLSDRLGGLSIQTIESDQHTSRPVTILRGQLIDQAALFGVLNALYNMRLPLIAVECISIDEPKGD